jgi:hypothetical protein
MNKEIEVLTDILQHVSEVRENMELFSSALRRRAIAHDRSKLGAFEFDAFVSTRADFKKANYGTPEYQACMKAIKPAVDHHYANFQHHTGHHGRGVNDMTLVDLLEMICDWKAAARRSPDNTFTETLDYAFQKYGIGGQLQLILLNTFTAMEWDK